MTTQDAATVFDPAWTTQPQPGYQINSTAISSDGSICLFGTSKEFDSGQFSVYCHDGDGALKWTDPLGVQSYQGVYWVALSDDGRYAAAGGTMGNQDQPRGFLRAYRVSDGKVLLQTSMPHRVNQVALSTDGGVLAVVDGSHLRVYTLKDDSYTLAAEELQAGQFCRSCDLSADGHRIVIGGSRDQQAKQASGGLVAMYELNDSGLVCRSRYPCETDVLHVAMLDDGHWWAGSRGDGKAMAFTDATTAAPDCPAWIYGPSDHLDTAYGLAIARLDNGQVRVVCGANIRDKTHGCLYAVQSPGTGKQGEEPQLLWLQNLQYDPNPGIHLDRRGVLLTATDGQPQKSGKETPGNFYLFHANDGGLIWRYPTPLMNWPMSISQQGNAVFAGSDDGTAYYWQTA